MTPQDIITELERIDAHVRETGTLPANVDGISFLRNHAGKLAEMLKVAVDAFELITQDSGCGFVDEDIAESVLTKLQSIVERQ